MATRLDLFERAAALAEKLGRGAVPVKRSAFQAVVGGFMSHGDLDRLRKTLELLRKGSGGHVYRGEGYGDQIRVVTDELLSILTGNEGATQAEYRLLFGWTGRLLKTESRKDLQSTEPPPVSAVKRERSPGDQVVKKHVKTPTERFGGLDSKSAQALAELKKKLGTQDC